jgi:ribonucleoside-diphosphate reductase alpha chain
VTSYRLSGRGYFFRIKYYIYTMPDNHKIPQEISEAFANADQYFPSQLQKFQFFDKYSRFNYDLGRRETWVETVDRSTNYLKEISNNILPPETYARIRQFILEMKATPSMRLLAMAGPAARKTNIAIYNCSYIPMDSIDSMIEELIIAMAGCGVGYSVEKQYVDKLPTVKMQSGVIRSMFQIPDSTEGWAEALRRGLDAWFNGENIPFDYSQIRAAGIPLKTKGGRASGPEPFKKLLDFSRTVILRRQGQKLRPVDAHDIACAIGEAIVSGGVRRTALIALFDLEDDEMRNCKNGNNIVGNEQRWMANNSAVWSNEMSQEQVLVQMCDMIKGQRGEPGIFSRSNANKIKPARRKEALFGTNPCGEINLRPYEFCNLSIAIARNDDTVKTLKEKVEIATIIGTIQSMATIFPGLRDIWKKNCEEERLLGVDITGQMDCPLLLPTNPEAPQTFSALQKIAVETNKKYAEILGVNPSASITCVKPSGNSSQLFNCASGLHPRWSKFYVRNVRVQAASPLRHLLQNQGVPMDVENNQTEDNATAYVIHFPVKSPDGAITRHDVTAIEQCEHWLRNKKYWTEHNPSVTIMYKPEEVIDLVKWVWDHLGYVGGMSFLPASDAQYSQMPYEEVSEEEYTRLAALFPNIDFSKLWAYEKEDFTTAAQELACMSGACEIDWEARGVSLS